MKGGEGYGEHKNENIIKFDEDSLPNFWISMLPIIVVLGMSFILSKYIFPHTNLNYLDKYNTTASKVIGNWSLIVSLIFSIIIAYIFNYKNEESNRNINKGS